MKCMTTVPVNKCVAVQNLAVAIFEVAVIGGVKHPHQQRQPQLQRQQPTGNHADTTTTINNLPCRLSVNEEWFNSNSSRRGVSNAVTMDWE